MLRRGGEAPEAPLSGAEAEELKRAALRAEAAKPGLAQLKAGAGDSERARPHKEAEEPARPKLRGDAKGPTPEAVGVETADSERLKLWRNGENSGCAKRGTGKGGPM